MTHRGKPPTLKSNKGIGRGGTHRNKVPMGIVGKQTPDMSEGGKMLRKAKRRGRVMS